MQQRVFITFLHARRATDDDHWRFFGERFRGRVRHLQSAHAIRYANRAQAAHTGVSVSREPGTLLVACVDRLEFAFGELIVKPKHVVAWNAKDMADSVGVKALDEVFAD